MSEIVLYAKNIRIADSSGNAVPVGARPVVRWREKVSFEIKLPNNLPITTGYFRYAFDYDVDFLDTAPCNAGECTLSEGKLTFDVVFNSLRQAKATNGRLKPIPFYIQISTLEDDFAEYLLYDAIWVAGCVWDGRAAPAEPASNYYTKEELDALVAGKLDAPEEPGETGYVLGLAEDGSTAWVPQTGGHGDVAWEDITGKPDFAPVATSGSYDDLSNKPSIPAEQVQSDWEQATSTAKDYIKNKPTLAAVATSGSYSDLSNKPSIPAAQIQADWNQGDNTKADFVKNKPNLSAVATSGSYADLTNKPTIPAAQVQSDWSQSDSSAVDYIKSKPNLAAVATSGSYNDLSNKPTIPAPQVQSDWEESDSSDPSYIQHKPTIPTASDYIPQTDKAAANGVATLDANALVPNLQLSRAITTIQAATSAYTLSDGVYQHTPSSAPTYTLPAVSDATKTHTVILCVSFASVTTIAFEDAGGTTIVPLDTLTISSGDVVEYLCRYDALQSKWVIACGKMNA